MSLAVWLSVSMLCTCKGEVVPVEGMLERVVANWCGGASPGVGYSHGEYFQCNSRVTEPFERTLDNVVIRIGLFEGDDFEYDCSSIMTKRGPQPKDSYSEFLLKLLQDVIHFRPQYITSNSWGHYNISGRGLVGLLTANSTDMAACHWTTTERFSDAVFLQPTLETTQSFVYLPENLPLRGDVFVEALSRKLWVFFLLSIFLLMASFWFSTYVHSRVRPDHEPWSWDEVVLWAVAAISQQSHSRHPRGSSCRTMFLIGYLITYLLYTGFAASITSLLALQSQKNELTLDSVAEMKLNLLLIRDEYNLEILEESKFDYLKLEKGGGEHLNEIFEKIRENNYLGFGSTITLLNFLRRKIPADQRLHFVVVPTPSSVRRKALIVRKSFPYKRLFNYWYTRRDRLLRFRETGFLDLGRNRYVFSEDTVNLRVTKWLSAGLENVLSAVLFLFGGWILSAVVLLAEILQGRKKKKE